MTSIPPMRVMIAGGGTGGHLFPGVALAERVKAAGGEVCFVGTAKGIEARVLPPAGWPLELMEVSGIKGRGIGGLVSGLARLPRAYFQSRKILKAIAPDLVVGVGGYASGPIVMTARSMGMKTAILEQNSVPGVTNKILGKVVHRVYTTFPDAVGAFPAKKLRPLGNPIRLDLLTRLSAATRSPRQTGDETRAPRLFVFGGSQGARMINDTVLEMLPALLAAHPNLEIWHQTGKAELDKVETGYANAGLSPERARVSAFITDMSAPYAWADLALCRAGATSLSELSAVGCPAVLIPFAAAADNHQEHNARSLVDQGAAAMAKESELKAEGGCADLAARLSALFGDTDALSEMSQAMLRAARPQAAEDILMDLAQLL